VNVHGGELDEYNKFLSKEDMFGHIKNPRYVGAVNREIYRKLSKFHEMDHVAVAIGGDHSLAVGTIMATAQRYKENYCVVWVDAHADVNTTQTSLSGNLHGCPLSFLCKNSICVSFSGLNRFEKRSRLRLG
jgi:arginase